MWNVRQGVCQVREVREKSGNSLYPLKSQGKVRELSDNSGNFSEIKKPFFGIVTWRKSITISVHFKNFWFLEDKYQGKVYKMLMESQRKLEKSQGIPCQRLGRHPVVLMGLDFRCEQWFSYQFMQLFVLAKLRFYKMLPEIDFGIFGILHHIFSALE